MPDATLCQEIKQPKLLDQVRQYLRLHHYSIHTERSYVDWIVRFIRFHSMRPRDDLFSAEPKIEVFLTHLAMEGNVAPATQNQAMNALVFLYKRVLRQPMGGSINTVRADKKVNVPQQDLTQGARTGFGNVSVQKRVTGSDIFEYFG